MHFSSVSRVFAHVYLMHISCILRLVYFKTHIFLMYFKTCISHLFPMYFMMSKMRNQCISHVFLKSILLSKWEINVFLMYCFRLRRFGIFQNTWEIHETYMSKYMINTWKNTWEIHGHFTSVSYWNDDDNSSKCTLRISL